ncbi:Uncharacterised protein [Mycobacterium tuberculosis]|nr:Uncharacterised protein [Mycobacterium tuberculosis]
MDRVCSASCLNGRTANAANSQANTAAAPMAKVQISSTRRCRLLVSATVASYVAPTATDVGSGPGISTVRTR